MAQGKAGAAEDVYRTALRLDPNFVPACVNLADAPSYAKALRRRHADDREAAALACDLSHAR